MRIRGLVVAAVLLTQIMVARAEEWLAPRVQNVFSSNGQYFVRVIPPVTVVNGAAGTGRPHGEFYQRQPDRSYRLVADVELQNRVSPTYAVVTDDGYLVTFDEWFQIGIGHVIVFYRPTGVVIRAVTIEELYTPDRLSEIPRSVSSRWWRCDLTGFSKFKTKTKTKTSPPRFRGLSRFSRETVCCLIVLAPSSRSRLRVNPVSRPQSLRR